MFQVKKTLCACGVKAGPSLTHNTILVWIFDVPDWAGLCLFLRSGLTTYSKGRGYWLDTRK